MRGYKAIGGNKALLKKLKTMACSDVSLGPTIS